MFFNLRFMLLNLDDCQQKLSEKDYGVVCCLLHKDDYLKKIKVGQVCYRIKA